MARSAIYIDKGVSIYIRPGSPFWQLRISRYGSRARESLNTTDVEAAKAIARKRADELLSHAEGVVIPRNVTYKDLMTVYKEHAELRNTESTRKLNLDNMNRIVKFLRRRIRVRRELQYSDFNLAAINAYAKWRKSKGKSAATINRELGSLSTFFTQCKKAKLIRGNPAADFDLKGQTEGGPFKLWYDPNSLRPLKLVVDRYGDTMTKTYQEFSVGEPIADDEFTFPPRQRGGNTGHIHLHSGVPRTRQGPQSARGLG